MTFHGQELWMRVAVVDGSYKYRSIWAKSQWMRKASPNGCD